MAFDFQKLMEDPQFQLGLGLLGNSSPRNAPFAAMAAQLQNMQKSKREMELEQAKLEQSRMQTQMYGEQIKESMQKRLAEQALAQQNEAIAQQLMPMIMGTLGGGQTQASPMAQSSVAVPMPDAPPQPSTTAPLQAAPPQPSATVPMPSAPPDSVDQFYNTKIIGRESLGRQFGDDGQPLTSPKGARGLGQLMPTTAPEAAKLAGVEWIPALYNRQRTGIPALDKEAEDYNRTLGLAYFKKQVADFGNLVYASAAYNAGPDATRKAIALAEKSGKPDLWLSFLPKETRDYVAATSGTDLQLPPKAPPLPPSTPMGLRNPGLPLQALAAIQGVRKGQYGDLGKLGEAMKPINVPAGGYQQDASGRMTYVPDPIAERRVAADEARTVADVKRAETDAQKEARLAAVAEKELKSQRAKDISAFDFAATASQSMADIASKLISNPGLDRIVGATGGLISPRLLGAEARRAATDLDTLKAKIKNEVMMGLKNASSSGATGYGALSDTENKTLESMVASLDRARDPKDIRASLTEIIAYSNQLQGRAQKVFESTYGESAIPGLPMGSMYVKSVSGKKVYKLPDGSMVQEK